MTNFAYESVRDVTCPDGKKRTARVRGYYSGDRFCWQGDTFFTVPAFVKVSGKTVRGFISPEPHGLTFCPNKDGTNAGVFTTA